MFLNSQYPCYLGFPGGSVVKNPSANAGDTGDVSLISESGRSLGVGNDNLFQYSCMENSMDRGAWRPIIHGDAKSDTTEQLNIHTHPCYLG